MIVFLNLSLADYLRYLCEVTLSDDTRIEVIKETDMQYQKFFKIIDDINLQVVNPASITGYYHYAIFVFEVMDKKFEAIDLLKQRHQMIINNLDDAYKYYIDSFPILDLLTETLTSWIINSNYSALNNE